MLVSSVRRNTSSSATSLLPGSRINGFAVVPVGEITEDSRVDGSGDSVNATISHDELADAARVIASEVPVPVVIILAVIMDGRIGGAAGDLVGWSGRPRQSCPALHAGQVKD